MKPVIEKGYAVITRNWKAGDRIELELPLEGAAREGRDEQIASTRGKVALRYGPLIYNIERVDQDISKSAGANAALRAEWRGDLLGGVTVIVGEFADGSPLLAIPNYARVNRDKDLPPEAGPLAADELSIWVPMRRTCASGSACARRAAGSASGKFCDLDASGVTKSVGSAIRRTRDSAELTRVERVRQAVTVNWKAF